MVNTFLICTLLSIVTIEYAESFGPPAGPYNITIEKLEECEDQGTGQVHFSTKMSNVGQGKYMYDETFNLTVPIDDKFMIYVDIQQWGNGGYRPRSIEHTTKNCEELWKVASDFLKAFFKSAGINVDKCPIKAGKYKADKYIIDVEIKNIPTMIYNKYRGILTFSYDGKKVGCICVYGTVIPKSKSFG